VKAISLDLLGKFKSILASVVDEVSLSSLLELLLSSDDEYEEVEGVKLWGMRCSRRSVLLAASGRHW
jgi:hypothetical protein